MTGDSSKPLNDSATNCPSCGAMLHYGHDGKMFSRVIGVYDTEKDRTVAWRCPDCGHTEAR